MFVITYSNDYTWFAKGTVWTSALERATKFATIADAQAHLAAMPFVKPAIRRAAQIKEV